MKRNENKNMIMAEKRKCTKDLTRAVAFALKRVIHIGPVNQSFESVFLQEYRRDFHDQIKYGSSS